MTSVPAVVVPAAKRQTATFIFLHGLGDTGNGWSSISENFRLRRKFDHCAFIFPHAPSIPITVNMGLRMPGWFDLKSLSPAQIEEDELGILKSAETVNTIISEQISKGIPSERIIIGGFSQGGATALVAAITGKTKIGGVTALSTWLPLHNKIPSMATEANKGIPIFQAHGERDAVVRFEWGQRSRECLTTLGHEVEWHSYPNLDHSADPQEIAHLEDWLGRRIPVLD